MAGNETTHHHCKKKINLDNVMILINFQLFNYLRTFQILLVCHSPMSIEPQNEIKLGLYLVWLESM